MRMKKTEQAIKKLKENLKRASEKNKAPCMLFSGGLDTAILAYLNQGCFAVNVSLENFGEDLDYAEFLACELGLRIVCML